MTVHIRNIALARGPDALHAFAAVARRAAAEVRAGVIAKQVAADRLQQAADAYLVDTYGDDEIQRIFSEAFDAR